MSYKTTRYSSTYRPHPYRRNLNNATIDIKTQTHHPGGPKPAYPPPPNSQLEVRAGEPVVTTSKYNRALDKRIWSELGSQQESELKSFRVLGVANDDYTASMRSGAPIQVLTSGETEITNSGQKYIAEGQTVVLRPPPRSSKPANGRYLYETRGVTTSTNLYSRDQAHELEKAAGQSDKDQLTPQDIVHLGRGKRCQESEDLVRLLTDGVHDLKEVVQKFEAYSQAKLLKLDEDPELEPSDTTRDVQAHFVACVSALTTDISRDQVIQIFSLLRILMSNHQYVFDAYRKLYAKYSLGVAMEPAEPGKRFRISLHPSVMAGIFADPKQLHQ